MPCRMRVCAVSLVVALAAGCGGVSSRVANKEFPPPPKGVAEGRGADPALADQPWPKTAPHFNGSFVGKPPGESTAQRDSQPPASFDAVAEHLAQARTERSRGNLDQAKVHYERVLQDVPNHAEAHHQMAIIADKQQRWSEAETHYRAALRVRPKDASLHSDLGYSYLLQGNLRDSEESLNAAVRIDPSNQHALNNLGLLYGRRGDYARAYETFRHTGTEEQAQQKMSAFFPEAVSSGAVANRNPRGAAAGSRAPASIDTAAYMAAAGDARQPPAAGNTPNGSASPGNADAGDQDVSDVTRGIKSEMQRARRDAELARNRGRTGNRPPGNVPPQDVGNPPANPVLAGGWSGSASPNATAAVPNGGYGVPPNSGPPRMPAGGRVQDRDLNRMFSEIDQTGPRNPPAAPRSAAPPAAWQSAPAQYSGNPEMFAGHDRRMPDGPGAMRAARPESPPNHFAPSSGPADGNDVWPPSAQAAGNALPPSRVERAGYEQDPRIPAMNGRPSPLAPTAAQIEAQRAATRIGMEAGPGGMFPYIDSPDPRSQPAGPNGWGPQGGMSDQGAPPRGFANPEGLMRPGGAGFVPDLSRQPTGAELRNPNPAFAPGAGSMGPGAMGPGAMNSRPGNVTTADFRAPGGPPAAPYARQWRDDEPSVDVDPTQPIADRGAVNTSYQEHANAQGLYQSNPLHDAEHEAILSQMRRERQFPPSAQNELGSGQLPLNSSQYYAPTDSSQQEYESMRYAAREGYQAQAGNRQNPTGANQPLPTIAGQPTGSAGAFRGTLANGSQVQYQGQPDAGRPVAPGGLSPWGSGGRQPDGYGPTSFPR